MDRIIRMVINIFIRQVVSRGINAGINRATRGRGQDRQNRDDAATPEQRAAERDQQQSVRRGMRSIRRASRFTRF
ncbi:hypothetical protein E2K80_03330 [Rhodophyticola sp. CCM32]|uniref:hypothetical protein n=1 Tax=Rhodophyticola sp. CCM32 TaxID=2916397 RepID=UPI00107F76EE|nr:hypothetical protein [Rhodophyticola sp. CCM32]QBX99883.1 hypothetical protein E2K80_03330 [Rhodophyticola sp. CCM32]